MALSLAELQTEIQNLDVLIDRQLRIRGHFLPDETTGGLADRAPVDDVNATICSLTKAKSQLLVEAINQCGDQDHEVREFLLEELTLLKVDQIRALLEQSPVSNASAEIVGATFGDQLDALAPSSYQRIWSSTKQAIEVLAAVGTIYGTAKLLFDQLSPPSQAVSPPVRPVPPAPVAASIKTSRHQWHEHEVPSAREIKRALQQKRSWPLPRRAVEVHHLGRGFWVGRHSPIWVMGKDVMICLGTADYLSGNEGNLWAGEGWCATSDAREEENGITITMARAYEYGAIRGRYPIAGIVFDEKDTEGMLAYFGILTDYMKGIGARIYESNDFHVIKGDSFILRTICLGKRTADTTEIRIDLQSKDSVFLHNIKDFLSRCRF